jgi:hypothetical protein
MGLFRLSRPPVACSPVLLFPCSSRLLL